jgi:methylenetetrahydrofolate dehydrogenase (NADP+)/methenyltetrahydrofolate cyclohydrolase
MSDTSLIDGKAVSNALKTELAAHVATMNNAPGLAVILVGDDPASHVYVRNKIKACEKVGIQSFEARLPEDTTDAEYWRAWGGLRRFSAMYAARLYASH